MKTVRVVLGIAGVAALAAAWAALAWIGSDRTTPPDDPDNPDVRETARADFGQARGSADSLVRASSPAPPALEDGALDDGAFEDEAEEPRELTPAERESLRRRRDRQLSLVTTLLGRVDLAIQEAERDGDPDRAQDLRATRDRLQQRREFVQVAIEEER